MIGPEALLAATVDSLSWGQVATCCITPVSPHWIYTAPMRVVTMVIVVCQPEKKERMS